MELPKNHRECRPVETADDRNALKAVARVPEFGRFPTEIAIERRDAELVAMADAAVRPTVCERWSA